MWTHEWEEDKMEVKWDNLLMERTLHRSIYIYVYKPRT
jgi:hypothetical protein